MKLYVVVTIDTEPDCSPNWRRSDPLTFRAITEGIPQLLQPIFKKYAVRPVYFVSSEVLRAEAAVSTLASLGDACELGAHPHPEYLEPEQDYPDPAGTRSTRYLCYDYNDDVEREKIKNYHALFQNVFRRRPYSHRAAKFGADSSTLRVLRDLGYHVDSSVSPRIDWSRQRGPDFRDFPDQPYFASAANFRLPDATSPLLEVPVTIGRKRLPFLSDRWIYYQWLRPTLWTTFEQKMLIRSYLRRYHQEDRVVLCMMFHNMEVVPRLSPYANTHFSAALILRRLANTLGYLASLGCTFVTLEELYQLYVAA